MPESSTSVPSLFGVLLKKYDDNYGWIKALKADLAWLALSGKCEYNHCDMQEVEHYVAQNNKEFIKLVRLYASSQFANLDVPLNFPKYAEPSTVSLKCDVCQKSFDTVQKLNLHKFKAHNIKDPIYRYINGTHCIVCMREFHTRTRLINHVRYRSHVCRTNLLLGGPLISWSQVEELDYEDQAFKRDLHSKGARAHHVVAPAFRLQGPIPALLIDNDCVSNHHLLGVGHNYG